MEDPTENPHKTVTHLGQDMAEILMGGKDHMIHHSALMEDNLEDWVLKVMVWVLHMDLMGSPLVMALMGNLKEEGARKRAQNMEWVQMEDLCQTMDLVAVILEEMI